MREKPEDTWQRIERYRRDLIDLCDEVVDELEENRRTREQWHAYTRIWKRIWLSPARATAAPAADGPGPASAPE